MDWEPLAKALEHATHVKEVRFLRWKIFEPTECHKSLKALVPPHVSVFHETQGPFGYQRSVMEII